MERLRSKKYLLFIFILFNIFPVLVFADNLTLPLPRKVKFHAFKLSHPDRLVIDLKGVKVSEVQNVWRSRVKSFCKINKLTFDEINSDTLRVKVYLTKPTRILASLKNYTRPFLLLSMSEVKPKVLQSKPIMIVIDPGHGGHDPGATGHHGIHEKDVVLAIARKLKYYLNNLDGYQAKLTRNTDKYLTLRQRLAVARKNKADMFISIHADAFKTSKAHGASIFALSRHGATSEAARWIAHRENKSELGGVKLSNKSRLLRSVLLDLSQQATISTSLQTGHSMLSRMKKVTSLHHSVVEQAAFVVLKSPDIPSLLVESGFISNWDDATNLNTPDFQRKLAESIGKGIKFYFKHHPIRRAQYRV